MQHVAMSAAALLLACATPESPVPGLVEYGEDELLQGGTLALPLASEYGTTVSLQYALGQGIVVAPLTFQHINGTEHATVTAAPNAALGVRQIDVSGINGYGPRAITQALTVTVTVVNPFTLSVLGRVSGRVGQVITGVVEVDPHDLFTGAIAFTMQGLPANAAITFSPLNRDRSTFTISAPEGTYRASVVGTSGAITRSVPLDVEILAPLLSPEFSLAISPNVLTMLPSDAVVTDITIARNAAVSGNITLTASGMPVGVTAVFSPASTSDNSSQLILTSVTATPGVPTTVTVTGVASGETRTATLSLAVVPVPNFTLTPAADTITLQNPLTTLGSVAISIGRVGQVGPVTLVANGLPAGVNAAFTNSPASGGTSTLVFSPTGTALPGRYTVTILGTANGLSRSTQVVLKVLASLGDFAVDFGLPSIDVVQGTTTALALSLPRSGTLIGAPITLAATTIPPQSTAVAPLVTTTSAGAIINLTVGAAAPLGAHALTVTATGGALTRTGGTIINIVAPPPPGFRLAAIPAQFQLARGAITPFAIGITRVSNFAGTVTLTAVSPLPGNITIEFEPFPSTPDLLRVNLYASPNVTPGPYVIAFRGTSGALTVTINITILVDP